AFRFYDPRVLRIYLPTCNAAEQQFVFGPVLRFLCEEAEPSTLLDFAFRNGVYTQLCVSLRDVLARPYRPQRLLLDAAIAAHGKTDQLVSVARDLTATTSSNDT